jgi:orotate phosphoribosyltransferase
MSDAVERNLELARMMVRYSCLEAEREEDYFELTSGVRSRTYFDCQITAARTEAMPLIGHAFIQEFQRLGIEAEAVGGLTRGADPIAQSVAFSSLHFGPLLQMFSVRKEQKSHGTRRWIEGFCEPGGRIVLVDDVATSGGSMVKAIKRCQLEKLEVVGAVVLVDREEGGMKTIADALPGVPVGSVFSRSEIEAFQEKLRASA